MTKIKTITTGNSKYFEGEVNGLLNHGYKILSTSSSSLINPPAKGEVFSQREYTFTAILISEDMQDEN